MTNDELKDIWEELWISIKAFYLTIAILSME